jgi:hypothetical protein
MMKRRRFLTVTVGVLGLVLITVGVVDLGQAWAKDKPRFTILSKDPDWVLDRTTALQWQKAPGSEPMVWSIASTYCTDLGGGSRLPEIKELISLVDYSKLNPALPEGHPFQGVQSAIYWSATPLQGGDPSFAWVVNFNVGLVGFDPKVLPNHAWCVR